MIAKKIKQLEAEMEPCSCGGRLVIANRSKFVPLHDEVLKNVSFVHFIVKCEKCGKWHGGFTAKVPRITFR